MGLFKKIFKGIGKVFKGIGKGIKKIFKGFGKFINKLGIFGQIGMMLVMPGIANAMMSGLANLGSGFMSNLASAGWQTAGQAAAQTGVQTTGQVVAQSAVTATGEAAKAAATKLAEAGAQQIGGGAIVTKQAIQHQMAKSALEKAGTELVAKKGMTAALARTSHAVLSSATKMIQTGVGTVSDVTGSVAQVVGDSVRGIGNWMTEGTFQIPKIDGGFEDILPNFTNRMKGSWENFKVGVGDTAKTIGHSLPGGPEYTPEYKTFKLTDDEKGINFGFGQRGKAGEVVTREVNYSTPSRSLFEGETAARGHLSSAGYGSDTQVGFAERAEIAGVSPDTETLTESMGRGWDEAMTGDKIMGRAAIATTESLLNQRSLFEPDPLKGQENVLRIREGQHEKIGAETVGMIGSGQQLSNDYLNVNQMWNSPYFQQGINFGKGMSFGQV